MVVLDNVLDVNLYNANNNTNYTWPDIQVMSTADLSPDGAAGQGITNDAGTVILATAPVGLGAYGQNGDIVVNGVNYGPAPPADSKGSIPIDGPVQAGTLVISTNGTLLVNLPGQVDETGGDPE